MRAELDSLELAAGHKFASRELFNRALTHRSHVHEHQQLEGAELIRDNEQLEFLGDSVLELLVSEALLERFPDYPEGRLSKIRAHLVSAGHLYQVALLLDLGRYLELGRGEEMSGGREKPNLLANAVEALIAAIYLDGGLEPARVFVRKNVFGPNNAILFEDEHVPAEGSDYKTALQELARSQRLPAPRYVTLRERGPEHSKLFTVEVRVGPKWVSEAEASNKKKAAQKAARDVYERLLLVDDAAAGSVK